MNLMMRLRFAHKFVIALTLVALVGVADMIAGSLAFEDVDARYQALIARQVGTDRLLTNAQLAFNSMQARQSVGPRTTSSEPAAGEGAGSAWLETMALTRRLAENIRHDAVSINDRISALDQSASASQTHAERMHLLQGVIEAIGAAILTEREREVETIAAQSRSTIYAARLFMPVAFVVIFSIALAGLMKTVVNPLHQLCANMTRLSEGDQDFEISTAERSDEIGMMARCVAVFKQNAEQLKKLEAAQFDDQLSAEAARKKERQTIADHLEETIKNIVNEVATAASQIRSEAYNFQTASTDVLKRVAIVKAASHSIEKGIEQTAAVVTQINSAISELSTSASKQLSMSSDAADEAKAAECQGGSLTRTIDDIGQIVSLIQDVAERTNLLALNATIEAARAGLAGRGFAVVAGEVKLLANQTSQASSRIASQIASVQGSTSDTLLGIHNLALFINGVRGVSRTISTVVDEQTSAMQYIVENMRSASIEVYEMTSSVTDIEVTARSAEDLSKSLLQAAEILTGQADMLKRGVQSTLNELLVA